MKILILNPNSSSCMTDGVASQLKDFSLPNVDLDYYTSPNGPSSINDWETIEESSKALLEQEQDLESFRSYDGIIIACYSPHDEMIEALRGKLGIPVVGIFESSVSMALSTLGGEGMFAIASTGHIWQEIFEVSVPKVVGAETCGRFAGTATTGLTALETHSVSREIADEKLYNSVTRLMKKHEHIEVIILGCAAMTGMGDVVKRAANAVGKKDIIILDPVKSAVCLMAGVVASKAA